MTLAELRVALSGAPDAAVLRAAVEQAPALAMDAAALIARATDGAWLTPEEEARAFHGLAIAACARRREAFAAWINLLRSDDSVLIGVLGGRLVEAATALTLGLTPAGDAAAAGDLIEIVTQGETHPDAARGLWRALARLLAAGEIPRPRMLAALDAFPDTQAAKEEAAFLGWAEAMALLGFERGRDRLANALDQRFGAADRTLAAGLLALHAASAEEEGLERFAGAGALPPDDPAALRDALWPPDEPAPEGLTPRAFAWLDAFLAEGEAGEAAMDLEAADGFMTALAVGPSTVAPAVAASFVLGAEPDAAETDAVAAARALIANRFAAMEVGWAAGEPPAPLLLEEEPHALGVGWAWGFLEAVARDGEAWAPIWRDLDAEPALALLQSIESDEPTRNQRAALVARLPEAVATIERYWRDPMSRRNRAPARVVKVGRNEPCPCGSGKKHKQCCLKKESP